ncbi:MAG: lytic transglycosylase domain-containing protein [Bdellovibrionales bacterium]
MKRLSLIALFLIFAPSYQANASQNWDSWLAGVKAEARQKGISENIINQSLSGIQPIPRVIELDRKQPEGTMTFAQYRQRVISDARIRRGRIMLKEHATALKKASEKYGVPAHYIVALWGIETSYGSNTGGFKVIPALATLAHDGRRSKFFRTELFNALKILDKGHIKPANMKGSWAGAMGQNQFMPSSFHTFAVDGNNDGKRNIWTDLDDVFASTANYLSKSGWKEDERWGRRVKLPQGFPESIADLKIRKTLKEWSNMGVRLPNGDPLPNIAGFKASIVTPDDEDGPAYLAYDNYRVIMKWNKSVYFATSVGLIADAISQN